MKGAAKKTPVVEKPKPPKPIDEETKKTKEVIVIEKEKSKPKEALSFDTQVKAVKRKRDDLRKEWADIQTNFYNDLIEYQNTNVRPVILKLEQYANRLQTDINNMKIISENGSNFLIAKRNKINDATKLIKGAMIESPRDCSYSFSTDSNDTDESEDEYSDVSEQESK